jgi:3-(methylthio)propionyl---CoA ligase
VVVRKPGADVSREALLDYYRDRTVRWWIPDDVVFVDELPHTATGKLSKRTLRERFRDHPWPAGAANQRRDSSA